MQACLKDISQRKLKIILDDLKIKIKMLKVWDN
jgi:hypothetical protein